MTERKNEIGRPYPPDYVRAETLAYRLDCSRSTIDAYVRAGLLPGPEMIGSLPRWDFAAVVAYIKARNQISACRTIPAQRRWRARADAAEPQSQGEDAGCAKRTSTTLRVSAPP